MWDWLKNRGLEDFNSLGSDELKAHIEENLPRESFTFKQLEPWSGINQTIDDRTTRKKALNAAAIMAKELMDGGAELVSLIFYKDEATYREALENELPELTSEGIQHLTSENIDGYGLFVWTYRETATVEQGNHESIEDLTHPKEL